MQHINKIIKTFTKLKRFKEHLNKIIKLSSKPKNFDFSLIRISPNESLFPIKEQFIPLARSTLIRKLSQNPIFVSNVNQTLFEDFNKYLEACIYNRNYFFLKEIKSSYENFNPDVELLLSSEGIQLNVASDQKSLDEEFWFIQKFSRMLELANFSELNGEDIKKWFHNRGGFTTMQVWVDASRYDVLKLWLLGKDNMEQEKGLIERILDNKYLSFLTIFAGRRNRYRSGNQYKRVVVAVRCKNNKNIINNRNKIDLKMFKDLSEGELIHTVPEVAIAHSVIDNSMLMWTAGLFAVGWGTHLMLPAAASALDSTWLSSTHHLAVSLSVLSGAVGLLHWNVIQNKKSNYWKWRSELNYRSIIANNRGVINVLGDRVQDEMFKECLLAYIHILAQPHGINQENLESHVRNWAKENCDENFKNAYANVELNLSEALSMLRQLNIVTLDQSNQLLTAKTLEQSATALGIEFKASNLSVDLDGNAMIRNDDINRVADQPIAEGYDKIRRTVNEDK